MIDRSVLDATMRDAAVRQVRRLGKSGSLTSEDLAGGFVFEGERVPLVNPQRGIFKPRAMPYLLSVRTVYPRAGTRIWYDDQRRVHTQIHSGNELIDYAFMGQNPDAADNRWLREAMENAVPVIYFLGIAPGRYEAIYPTYVVDWSAPELVAKLAFAPAVADPIQRVPTPAERRYALRQVGQRLHQASFREAVLAAYGGRCAITNLPEPRLLDAAHIIPDADKTDGLPIVSNGIPLTKIHHSAFDANLIAIDHDYRIHVSEELLSINDGPMFEHGLKAMAGRTIQLPARAEDRPDRDRLARRFESYIG